MDYDLSRLSTRSFEQLIQSLAHSVIGPGVVIFGDGRDGGREATFEGQIAYPNDAERWQGYGVIQAKFKQRPEGGGKDGDWALQELKEELKKFTSPNSKLKKPEYYIFATNVVLTPVAEVGGKDKLSNYLKSQKSVLGLKDFRIWDYDQLRVMLDNCADVRTAYAAWITAGDVLGKLIETMRTQRPDFRAVMRSYLQKELCADQYVNLNQAGHQPKDRIPLAQVFVDLPHGDQTEPKGTIATLLNLGAQNLSPKANLYKTLLNAGSGTPIGRLVFIGGPGQGKTTLSQFVCQLFRVALLRQEDQALLCPEAVDASRLIIEQIAHEGLELPCMPRFPVRVVLNSFAADLAAGKATSLLGYLLQRISTLTDRTLSTDDFRNWLATYPWLLVLDGLDEVPVSSNREQVITAVQNFLVDAQGCNADLLLVATTRPQGYDNDFSPAYYNHSNLLPLDVPRALRYADRLLEQRWGGDRDKIAALRQRLQRAGEEDATARLMRSPLQVTIMAMLVESVGQPPRERWRLFNDYYRVIYNREQQRDIPAAELLNSYQADIDAIHQRVGLRLQADSERSGATDALLPESEFGGLVHERLESEGHSGPDGERLKQQIMDASMARLVFLVAPQADKVGFEIRSLQEFMAAQCLMNGSDQDVQQRLRAIAPAAHWRNVFLFAAGRCFHEKQHLRDTLHALCCELNEGDGIESGGELEKTTLAGSRLALEILEDGALAKAPAKLRLFCNLALRLMELPPCDEQLTLAEQYSPDLQQTFQSAIESRLADTVMERRLGAWRVLLHLEAQGHNWAQDLARSVWPSEADDAIRIIQACKGLNLSAWLLQKWLEAIFKVYPNKTHLGAKDDWNSQIGYEKDIIWLNYILELVELNELEIDINEIETDYFKLKVNPIFVVQEPGLIKPICPDDGRKEWKWLIQAINFQFNLDCTKEALVQLLLEYSSWSQEERDSLGEFRYRLAWPIYACIEMAADDTDVERLASAILNGDLGDKEDWISAQERWKSQGLEISDFEYMPAGGLSFDTNIAAKGFPFLIRTATLKRIRPTLPIAKKLFSLWQSISYSLAKTRVADHILFLLGCAGEYSEVWDSLEFEDFKSLISDCDVLSFRFGILGAIPELFWESQGFLEILEKHGLKWFIIYDPQARNAKFISKLEALVIRYPNKPGILRLLSIACLTGRRPDLGISPDPEAFSEPRAKLAVTSIKIAQGNWVEDEAVRLADKLTNIGDSNSEAIDSALKIIASQKLTGRPVELFLDSLYARLRANEWEQRRDVLHAMLEQQRHRQADVAKLPV